MTKLKNIPATPLETFSKKDCEDGLQKFREKLFDLQNIFYADGRFALLLVFQGLDTSGKDGTVRHVMSSMNPMGVNVKPFKQPTEEEKAHDFLWRVYPHFPAKGMIEVFNRSYYEDILVPVMNNTISKEELKQRYDLINALERHLESSGVHILKFFLHVSQEEQQIRIKERLTQPHKKWKYDPGDESVAEHWDEYAALYDRVMDKTNDVEWKIIPADKRWYRNFAVAKILTEHLESLHLEFPGRPNTNDD